MVAPCATGAQMYRPVERFGINTKAAPPADEGEGGPARRLRPPSDKSERASGVELAFWAFSMALLAYAAWMVASLWLYS